jgi:hypothetical protein
MAKKQHTQNGADAKENLRFEATNDKNIVKAISYKDGKVQESFLYVMTEEQFEALIPESEKKYEQNPALT